MWKYDHITVTLNFQNIVAIISEEYVKYFFNWESPVFPLKVRQSFQIKISDKEY